MHVAKSYVAPLQSDQRHGPIVRLLDGSIVQLPNQRRRPSVLDCMACFHWQNLKVDELHVSERDARGRPRISLLHREENESISARLCE